MFQSTLLWQNDEQWAGESLGFGPQTIKEWGCLMTSLTMVVNGYGYNETPQTFNQKMKAAGGFSGAMVKPAAVATAFPGVTFGSYDDSEQSPAPIGKIDAALASGSPVIVQIDWSPQPGLQSHWVLAYARQGNDYLILDPYRYAGDAPDKQLTLLSRYHYRGLALEQAITAAIFMSGTTGHKSAGAGPSTPASVTPTAQPKVAVPADALTVYATGSDLALRADPAVSGNVVTRLALNSALLGLESKSTALAKVGQQNQWLQVQDPAGNQGFVAAWYVSTSVTGTDQQAVPAAGPTPAAPAPATPATSAQADNALIVTPTTDGLALRDQPSLTSTVLKRLPLTSRLKVLEPAAAAALKLGSSNQWLNVRDITGQAGYVAAWYATAVDNPAIGVKTPTPESGPVTPTTDLVVRTTADQVALRQTPVVSDTTLIKYLPLRAELLVLEAGGLAKVGQQNQWLNVKDLDGTVGYVAAWYVSR
jgi:hypothetical protein